MIRMETCSNQGGFDMPNIEPVSELRNYGQILEKVKPSSPVYLTKNGRGMYSLHSIEDDEEFEKAKAMVAMIRELETGFQSAEQEGWLTDEEIDQWFKEKRKKRKEQEKNK